ncbi:hypothetical protein CHH28_14415 [Bacterioplanes sanyensis]|uniref:GGDEF domain-containing protein n=1 Tax=Bacterioplanes sanyensis TaxID=1249553 RepID=A0A222FLY4_9GAMM|nr:GGDEF domain-containing protein [Bacterioplanes sanyensis]ASP39790.1 hypothetical protein CHH28_14415 [Bacterioplanes sanyensis]
MIAVLNKQTRINVLYSMLTVATVLGLIGSLVLSWFWNMQSLENEFESEANVISQYVREKMAQNETLLVGLYTYFKDKPNLEIQSARHYASIMASRFSHVHMFQAAQFVSQEDWGYYSALMDSQGEEPTLLQLVDGEGLVRRTELQGEQSIPVIMVEPTFLASQLGLDLSTIDFIANHFPEQLSEQIVLTEPFLLLDDEPVMVMMQTVLQQQRPQFLSILVVKVSDLLPTVNDDWNLSVNLNAVVGEQRFGVVGQSAAYGSGSHVLKWLPPLQLSREIPFRDYALELNFDRQVIWSDIKWGWFVVVALALIVLPTLYRQMFTIHSRFEALEEAQRQQLYQKANYDTLTGLPNRYHFEEYANRLLSTAERTKASVALLFLDLNGFKAINDQLGHDTGDYVLEQVGNQLLEDLRRGDMAARIGGDEFVVIIDPVASIEQLLVIIERLRATVDAVNGSRIEPLSVSASIGFAYTDAHGYELEELMRIADNAMYEEKRRHKSKH